MKRDHMMHVLANIEGKVQGVFFRKTVKKYADQYNVKGYVKNLPDGSVEILAQGDESVLNQFFSEIESHPEKAQIEKISKKKASFFVSYSSFTIEY